MKGEICPVIGRVNERMENLGLEPYPSAYLCQTGSCGGCYLYNIAKRTIPDYNLR